jgi:hypothetical protein
MFFNISHTVDTRFSESYTLGPFILSVDEGWNRAIIDNLEIIYKGYSDLDSIHKIIDQLSLSNTPQFKGNFCAILYDFKNENIEIKHSVDRSFPIYANNNNVTNFEKLEKTYWADKLIQIDKDFNITEDHYDNLGVIDCNANSKTVIVDKIYNLLDEKIKKFVAHNVLPINIYLSGGLDTMLVYSFIKKYTDNFNIINGVKSESNYFWDTNSHHLKTSYWGYNQIHHWKNKCVLASGAPGDEFMLRSPTTGNLYLMSHNTNMNEFLNNDKKFLHKLYFSKEKHIKIYQRQSNDPFIKKLVSSKQHLYRYIINMNENDFQHFHIGNTITYTPLRDLNMFKLFLQLPYEDAISQLLDGAITKELISKNDCDLINHLTNDKNSGDYTKINSYIKSITSS